MRYADARARASARWSYASPYRIGLVCGQAGDPLTALDALGRSPRWLRLYTQGWLAGLDTTEKPS